MDTNQYILSFSDPIKHFQISEPPDQQIHVTVYNPINSIDKIEMFHQDIKWYVHYFLPIIPYFFLPQFNVCNLFQDEELSSSTKKNTRVLLLLALLFPLSSPLSLLFLLFFPVFSTQSRSSCLKENTYYSSTRMAEAEMERRDGK